MGCQISTNQAPQQPTTVLPANLPQTQADWSRFIQRMQEMMSAIRAAGYTTGVNAVPTQYSVYDGTGLPGLRITGATASLDSVNVQFGVASIKLVATGSQITLTLASTGYPATIHPYWKWIASLYCRTDQASLSGTLAVATATKSYSDDISGAVTALMWSRLYGSYDLTADAATSATLTLTLNTVVGATYWLEAWQLEPVQGDTALPSPFIITSPPRTWGQVVNDGNKPADGADVTSQNTAADTAHVNGVAASTVQGNASTSIGQVTQLPVINGGFDIAPTGYGWTADAGSGWTIDTAGNTPGVGPNSAMHAAGAGSGAYRNAGLAACLPGQVYKAQGLIKAVGANGACWVYISWCNAAGVEIGSTAGNQVTGTTTTGSYVVGTAPAGTVYARTCLGVSGHTAGTYYVDNVLCSQYPSSLGEVADGGGRYGVHAVDSNGLAVVDFSQAGHVNKTLDYLGDGSTYARVLKNQVSNGVVSLLTAGRNLVFNGNFTSNVGGFPNSQGTVGACIRDGWALNSKDVSGINPLYDTNALAIGFIFGSGVSVPANGQVGATWVSNRFPVQAGLPFALRIYRSIYLAQALPAGLTAVNSVGIDWYTPAGGYISSAFIEKTGSFGTAYDVTPGTVPSTAGYAFIRLFGLLRNSTGSAIVTSNSNTAEPLFNSVEFLQQADLASDVAGTLSTQRNLPMVTWGNYGSMWSGLTLTYSTTTTSCTFSASAASLIGGGDSIAYNSGTVTVTGSPGTTVTYWLYYDDPTGTGGSKSLQATTTQLNSLNSNGRVRVAQVTVTYPTSGTGGGTAPGGCPQVDEPVIRRAPDGSEEVIRAGDVRVGDYLLLSSGRWGRVTYSEAKKQPGVRVVGADGSSITCSASAPLETADGPCVTAPYVRGLVLKHRRAGVMRVAEVFDAGDIWVQHITCENDCFWVGDYSHHNLKPGN
jgi:hypothetical protein